MESPCWSTNIKSDFLRPDLCGNSWVIKRFVSFLWVVSFRVCALLSLSLMGRVTHQHCPCVTPVSPPPATKAVVMRDTRDLLRKKELMKTASWMYKTPKYTHIRTIHSSFQLKWMLVAVKHHRLLFLFTLAQYFDPVRNSCTMVKVFCDHTMLKG